MIATVKYWNNTVIMQDIKSSPVRFCECGQGQIRASFSKAD
jgi:hypothetical protein